MQNRDHYTSQPDEAGTRAEPSLPGRFEKPEPGHDKAIAILTGWQQLNSSGEQKLFSKVDMEKLACRICAIDLAYLVANLTSPVKAQRAQAKCEVRALVRAATVTL